MQGICWRYVGIMEKKMETIGILAQARENCSRAKPRLGQTFPQYAYKIEELLSIPQLQILSSDTTRWTTDPAPIQDEAGHFKSCELP